MIQFGSTLELLARAFIVFDGYQFKSGVLESPEKFRFELLIRNVGNVDIMVIIMVGNDAIRIYGATKMT